MTPDQWMGQWMHFDAFANMGMDFGLSRQHAMWGSFALGMIGNPINTTEKLAGKAITFAESQLQSKFKHAIDFGVESSWGKGAAEEFQAALSAHIESPATQAIQGTYRGTQDVTHFFNPETNLNVMVDSSGAFISGWKLNSTQIENVTTRGSL